MEPNPLLLPTGLYDLLPPDARAESEALSRLLGCFAGFGYEQVSPPLMEFEASLLAGRGAALAGQTFRVMDPISRAMMGFRPDITMQIARIAKSRLASAPRPLRLCYAGPILLIKPEPLKSERQLMQAGIELIGADSPNADFEVMMIAAEALQALGIADISIDINLPALLGELCPEAENDAELRVRIRDAVSRKDVATIARLPLAKASILATLAGSAGPVDKALAAMRDMALPETQAIADITTRLRKECPGISLTLDPVEYRGFEYHQGISFSLFAKGVRHELGRGGRYMTEGGSATGFTLYVTHLLGLLAALPAPKRILLPQSTDATQARSLREAGWATLYALTNDLRSEAKRLACTHIYDKGKTEAL